MPNFYPIKKSLFPLILGSGINSIANQLLFFSLKLAPMEIVNIIYMGNILWC